MKKMFLVAIIILSAMVSNRLVWAENNQFVFTGPSITDTVNKVFLDKSHFPWIEVRVAVNIVVPVAPQGQQFNKSSSRAFDKAWEFHKEIIAVFTSHGWKSVKTNDFGFPVGNDILAGSVTVVREEYIYFAGERVRVNGVGAVSFGAKKGQNIWTDVRINDKKCRSRRVHRGGSMDEYFGKIAEDAESCIRERFFLW